MADFKHLQTQGTWCCPADSGCGPCERHMPVPYPDVSMLPAVFSQNLGDQPDSTDSPNMPQISNELTYSWNFMRVAGISTAALPVALSMMNCLLVESLVRRLLVDQANGVDLRHPVAHTGSYLAVFFAYICIVIHLIIFTYIYKFQKISIGTCHAINMKILMISWVHQLLLQNVTLITFPNKWSVIT